MTRQKTTRRRKRPVATKLFHFSDADCCRIRAAIAASVEFMSNYGKGSPRAGIVTNYADYIAKPLAPETPEKKQP